MTDAAPVMRRLAVLSAAALVVLSSTTTEARTTRRTTARRVTTTTARRSTTTTARPVTTTSTTAAPIVGDLVPGTGPGVAPPGAQGGGPWSTRVHLARSADGLTFTRDPAPLIDQAGVPNLMTDAAGRSRLYYIDWPNGNVIAVAVENSPGRWAYRRTTITGRPAGASAVDPSVLLVGKTYRLYFAQGGPDGRMAVHTASSADGFAFRYDGVAYQPAGSVFDPTVLVLGGRYLLWAGPDGANAAVSTDGLRFTETAPLVVDGRPFMVWSAANLPGGRARVFGQALGPGAPTGIVSATSGDGVTWTLDPGVRLTGASDHGVVQRADGSWLLAFVERI